MTQELHGNLDLKLGPRELESIDSLIEGSQKICFSGEGETLMAWRSILTLLARPGTGRIFEIISSAFWPKGRLMEFLDEVDAITSSNGDYCNFRVSIDRFHGAKVKHNNLAPLIQRFLGLASGSPQTLGFRSITGEEDYVKTELNQAAESLGLAPSWTQKDELRYKFHLDGHSFGVEFKNVVWPSQSGLIDPCPLPTYISILTRRYNRSFTLGSLEYTKKSPGFDITLNPNGDVVFYGMENEVVGNISREKVDYEAIAEHFDQSKICQTMYTQSFLDFLDVAKKDPEVVDLIEKVNNPYWVIRNLEERFSGKTLEIVSQMDRL